MAVTLPGGTAHATTLTPIETQQTEETKEEEKVEVGEDEWGNTTVLYHDHLYTKKAAGGWFIRATYIYNGTDLDTLLDKRVAGTRYTSTRYDGFLFVRMAGGWYRHELHIRKGSALCVKLDELAGIVAEGEEKVIPTPAPTITGR
ncbi:MAG: hypothetical protein IJT34_04820 [Butyrivibrio sp.]|nr:hypothetical protein [Butyrivibrio sp.]